MTNTLLSNRSNNLNLTDNCGNSATNAQNIFDLFKNTNTRIFIPLESGRKYSFEKGWNEKQNLISTEQAEKHLQEGGNVGLVIGKWFNGFTYVLFDVEEWGILPEAAVSIIDTHALETQITPHEGRNRIVRIDSREAYNLLDSYPTAIKDITEGDSADIELMTNAGTPLPPSEINHAHCSKEKSCEGEGVGRYVLESINHEAPAMDIDSVRRLGEILGIEADPEPEEEIYSEDEDTEAPSVDPKINPQKEFADNVPSVEHSFDDRLKYMKFGDWDGQSEFIQFWHGNFESVSGSNKQGRGECKLANKIGFFFGRNQSMIQLLMSTLPFESYYEKYPNHRKYLLDKATSVDWVFCEGVSFRAKSDVAYVIHLYGKLSVNEMVELTEFKKRMIQYTVNVLEAEGKIKRQSDGRTRTILNDGITEGYLMRLENVNEKHNPNSPKVGV